MRRFWLILAGAAAGAALHAQTNAPTPAAERPATQIFSDSVEFDLTSRMAIYKGHVRVDDAKMKMSCELLTAKMPEGSSRIESIIGETNVVIDALDEKGQTNRATGDKIVYTYKVVDSVTNEMAEIFGNPRIESPQGWLTGDTIIWDRANNKVHATGKINMGVIGAGSVTNLFPGATNPPAGAKN